MPSTAIGTTGAPERSANSATPSFPSSSAGLRVPSGASKITSPAAKTSRALASAWRSTSPRRTGITAHRRGMIPING